MKYNHFEEVAEALRLLQDPVTSQLHALLFELHAVIAREGTIYVAGNGGSAANALHWVCDLVKAAHVPALVLGSNMALLTADSNDYGYERSFSAEANRIGPQDLIVALSCSGTSPNIVRLIQLAQRSVPHLPMVLLTGALAPEYEHITTLRVASVDYAVIEDVHAILGHWVTKELTS